MEHIQLLDSETGDVAFYADTLDYRVKNIYAYFTQRKFPRNGRSRWVGEIIIRYAQEQAANDAFNSLSAQLLSNCRYTLPAQEGVFVIDALCHKSENNEVHILLEEVL